MHWVQFSGNEERGLASGHVLRRRVAAASRHHAHRGEGGRPAGRNRSPNGIRCRSWRLGSPVSARPAPRGSRASGMSSNPRRSRSSAPSTWEGSAGREAIDRSAASSSPTWNLAHPAEAVIHDLHVRLHDGFAELAELLPVLRVRTTCSNCSLTDLEVLKQRRETEKNAPRNALPCILKLQVRRGLVAFRAMSNPGSVNTRILLLEDLRPRPNRQPLPRVLRLLVGLPDESAALRHALERIAV